MFLVAIAPFNIVLLTPVTRLTPVTPGGLADAERLMNLERRKAGRKK